MISDVRTDGCYPQINNTKTFYIEVEGRNEGNMMQHLLSEILLMPAVVRECITFWEREEMEYMG